MRTAIAPNTEPCAAVAEVRAEPKTVDVEAEAHLVALALRHGQVATIDASELGHPAMRAIWRAIEAVAVADETTILVAVAAELRTTEEIRLLRAYGGLEYLLRLWSYGRALVPASINYWCGRVRAAARRRRLALLAARLHEVALLGDDEGVELALADLREAAAW